MKKVRNDLKDNYHIFLEKGTHAIGNVHVHVPTANTESMLIRKINVGTFSCFLCSFIHLHLYLLPIITVTHQK
jgi:hypothetical protein